MNIIGKSYLYKCKSCGHSFIRKTKFVFFCPKCKSIRIYRING